MSWASCVPSKNYCLQCPLSGEAASGVEETLGWVWPPCSLSDDCGVGEGTELLTLTPLWAQTHAGTGKQLGLWKGCVTAAPQWCDGHMIFLWCLLLKDEHLACFCDELQHSGQGWSC